MLYPGWCGLTIAHDHRERGVPHHFDGENGVVLCRAGRIPGHVVGDSAGHRRTPWPPRSRSGFSSLITNEGVSAFKPHCAKRCRWCDVRRRPSWWSNCSKPGLIQAADPELAGTDVVPVLHEVHGDGVVHADGQYALARYLESSRSIGRVVSPIAGSSPSFRCCCRKLQSWSCTNAFQHHTFDVLIRFDDAGSRGVAPGCARSRARYPATDRTA
jgi:hypothetical protein